MTQREIVLWVDERWCEALEKHLLDGSVSDRLEEYVDELVNQLPENVYEKISREIWQEQQQAKLEAEAARRFAVFHVTEEGSSVYFSTQRAIELLDAAKRLRSYVRKSPEDAPARFVGMFQGERITEEQFKQYASERMDNTGRVTGAFKVDLDRSEFAALHIMDGWKVYRVKDVSAAAYHAFKKQGANSEERLVRLMEKLDGKELTCGPAEPEETCGSRRLRKEDIVFSDEIREVDGLLNFPLYCAFNVDEVFGTHVETGENDDYLNVYANYDMAAGRVCYKLEITLCHGDGTDSYLYYRLDDAELAAVESRMEGYCFEQTGMGLKEYSDQFMAEEPEQAGMQGPQM